MHKFFSSVYHLVWSEVLVKIYPVVLIASFINIHEEIVLKVGVIYCFLMRLVRYSNTAAAPINPKPTNMRMSINF